MDISTAMLSGRWEVEVLPLDQKVNLVAGQGDELTVECNSWCRTKRPALDDAVGLPLSTVTVEVVHLAGRSEVGTFTISMFEKDLFGGLRLDTTGKPFLGDPDVPNFWLEGRMTIKLKLAGSNQVLSLVSRKPVLQTGRATSWPPYNTVMRDVSGPNEYVPVDKQDGDPILILWSGSITIEGQPSPFLATDIPIRSFNYVETGDVGRIDGVVLRWDDVRAQVAEIDHFHVYKRVYGVDQAHGPWQQIGGHLRENTLLDKTFDGSAAVTYKVRQIMVDALGDEVMGCGNETEFTVPALPSNRAQLFAAGFK